MGVILSGTTCSKATGFEAQSFWQRIARSFDRFFARRIGQAVSASLARRSKYDFKVCRQLKSRGSNDPTTGKHPRTAVRRTAQMLQKP